MIYFTLQRVPVSPLPSLACVRGITEDGSKAGTQVQIEWLGFGLDITTGVQRRKTVSTTNHCSTCKHFTARPERKTYLDGDCSFPRFEDSVKSTWTGCRHHSAVFGGDRVKSQEMTEPMFANIP